MNNNLILSADIIRLMQGYKVIKVIENSLIKNY